MIPEKMQNSETENPSANLMRNAFFSLRILAIRKDIIRSAAPQQKYG
jgi:hypothetical protein